MINTVNMQFGNPSGYYNIDECMVGWVAGLDGWVGLTAWGLAIGGRGWDSMGGLVIGWVDGWLSGWTDRRIDG